VLVALAIESVRPITDALAFNFPSLAKHARARLRAWHHWRLERRGSV